MQTISATDLARSTRHILDRVAMRGETIAVMRNHAVIANIAPAAPTMTAAQALSGLPPPMLTAVEAKAWIDDSRAKFDETVRDPWA